MVVWTDAVMVMRDRISRYDGCECADHGCPVHAGEDCGRKRAAVVLYRVDMQDESGVAFCDECADDAFESGLFATREEV